jgi:transposase
MYLERSYSGLLWESLERVYRGLGFDVIDDLVFMQLVLARLIEPTSKLDTVRVLEGLGLNVPSYPAIRYSLRKVIDEGYRDILSKACFRYVAPSSLTLVLYDVTTLYFEAQKEDEYRRPGYSKERRLDPQITVGLLVDRNGFPLEVQSFEGNRSEVKTLIPILAGFKARHGLQNITVTADAAMFSAGNLSELEKLGYNYIVASKLAKTPYEIEEYLSEEGVLLRDGQIVESRTKVLIDGRHTKRRVIYQYRQKRASLDLRNINKLVLKAQSMVEGKADIKRNRFNA